MGKPEEVTRNYNGSDDEMLETAKTVYASFIEDKSDFENFDSDYKDPFAADWKSEIDAAEGSSPESSVKSQLGGLSSDVEEAMDECRNKFQTAKHFIEKAFPDNKAVWNEFGYNEYDKARNVQSKMILFMQQFFNTATKYKYELIAKKYTQAMIDEILTMKNNLDSANQKQENFKKGRPVLTQERIINLNKCWKNVTDVARSGKLIYTKDFAKYQKYVISPSQIAVDETPPPLPPPAPKP